MDYSNAFMMERNNAMNILFSFSIFALIWSLYYLAMHTTGGILTMTDKIVCGSVIVFCVAVITWNIVIWIKKRKTR